MTANECVVVRVEPTQTVAPIRNYTVKAFPFDWGSFFVGVLIGTIFIGPFIWTGFGRSAAKLAIAKGAAVTKEQVEAWMKRGEEK